MKQLLIIGLLSFGLAIAGCSSNDTQTVWGTYQEPVQPQPLPPAAGVQEINVLWKKSLGFGADQGYALLEPAYQGNHIYAANRDGSVFKLAAATGKTIWQRDLNSAIFSGVGVDDDLAVIGLENGKVIALEASTGRVRWETPLNLQISAIPAVGAGRVVVRTASGLSVGLDAANGEATWSIARAMPGLSIHGDSTPGMFRDIVFLGFANGKLIAMNAINGREYWETRISPTSGRNELERLTDADAAPLVTEDTLYSATYQGKVAALQWQDSIVQWKADVSTRLPMSLGDNQLLVTDELGEVLALNTENGEILWKQDGLRGRGISNPLVISNRVVVGDSSGSLYLLDINNGRLLEIKTAVNEGAVLAVIALNARKKQFATISSEGDITALSLGR